MSTRKRHRWTTDTSEMVHGHARCAEAVCLDCSMSRHREGVYKQAGCYGKRWVTATYYRYGNGQSVYRTPNMRNRVPPCRPPRRLIP